MTNESPPEPSMSPVSRIWHLVREATSPRRDGMTSFALPILLVGFTCLAYELVMVRMLSFFLGNISNFLAIPIALLGLALGSLYCHFRQTREIDRRIATFSVPVFPLLLLSFIVFFLLANGPFNQIHTHTQNLSRDSVRLIVYSGVFLPPYFVFGVLLSSFFAKGSDRIGRLYFFDLLGAALGCVVTPLMLTYTDLPWVILVLLIGAAACTAMAFIDHRRWLLIGTGAALVVLTALVAGGVLFKETPNVNVLASTIMGKNRFKDIKEVSVRWNHIARTSLLTGVRKQSRPPQRRYAVVQDDGISNVSVLGYDPAVKPEGLRETDVQHLMAFALDHKPRRILVIFAGVGRDMVVFDKLADGQAAITGVEINELVVNMADHPALRKFRLREFLDRPEITLLAREGRDFLNSDTGRYDLIFVATNGAVHANRTGHTRKYLDTFEAMAAYLDHLDEDGVIMFSTQPVEHKLASFRQLFVARGLKGFEKAVYAFSRKGRRHVASMMIKPDGFTRSEVMRCNKAMKAHRRPHRLLYSPMGFATPHYKQLVSGPEDPHKTTILTDDRPFLFPVTTEGFTLRPKGRQLTDKIYASNWIKLVTLLLFGGVALIVMLVVRFSGDRAARLPFAWLGYFLTSGVGYMCVEVGLMAKTELLLGSPLYAVAIILALFLTYNAVGAYLQDRFNIMRGAVTLAGFTAPSILFAIAAVKFGATYMLSAPLIVKILGVAVGLGPAALTLGMFYPFGVATLVRRGMGRTVSITYGLATLSSVLGSAWAMTAFNNLGFTRVILIGAGAYTLTALIYLITPKKA